MARRLKDWLNAYIAYTNFNEAPQQYNFWAGIAAIAGALRKKVYIDQLFFRWTPNFYIILVGPSGISKSTSIDTAMDLLRSVQGIYFGPDTMSWQALVEELRAAEELIDNGKGENETQSCLTFASSELGSLVNFRDSQFITVLTDLWDGKNRSWRKATVTKDHAITTNPWINIVAGTTPSWIAENIPKHIIGGGLTSRCIFVWGDKKKRLVAYPRRVVEQQQSETWFNQLKTDLIRDLEEISLITGEYELDDEAEIFGKEWYDKLHTNPPNHLLLGNFDGYLSRKQGHVHKVAMVVAASYKNEKVISKGDLEKAIILANSIEAEMPRVFSHIRADDNGARIEDLMRMMRVYRRISRPALFSLAFSSLHMQKDEFDKIINSACEAGLIRSGAELMLEINQSSESPARTVDIVEQISSPAEVPVLEEPGS